MPSPVGHSLLGYLFYRATASPVDLPRWRLLAVYLFAANAPDLDFIPGFLIGDPNRYHHGISHSVGFAVLFASAFSLFLLLWKRDSFIRKFTIFFSLYFSHLVLDYLSIDTSAPYGELLFWPFSNEYYIAPFAFLPDIQRTHFGGEFITSLFSLHNISAMFVEFMALMPFLWLVVVWRRRWGGLPN